MHSKYLRLLILFSLLISASGFSQTYFEQGSFRYEVTSDVSHTVSVVEFLEWGTQSATIPSTINNSGNTYTVTAIGDYAFRDRNLRDIIIPETVTSIGNGAFEMNNLSSITLPADITYIGMDAFRYELGTNKCNFIKYKPSSKYFWIDSFMIDLTIPKGSAAAYEAAGWINFRSITEVDMGSTDFEQGSFRYEVTSDVNHTVSVVEFLDWGTSATIPSTINNSGITYTVTAIGDYAFRDRNLRDIIIPETVTSIGNGAFEMNQLTSITLPADITYIGRDAFHMNWELRSVTSLSTNPVRNPFMDAFMIDFTIPKGSAAAYEAAEWTSLVL